MDYQKNRLCQVRITDLGKDGEGIGKIDGFPFFVKDVIPGDLAEIIITKTKKNYAYGRLNQIIEPSPDRVDPPCPVHRSCGGCTLQVLSYKKQLEFKQKRIEDSLIRIGGFSQELIQEIMEPIVGMEEPLRYRNKAQYPFGYSKEGEVITGFYAQRTHSIIANTDCLLEPKENKDILEVILNFFQEMERGGGLIYDEKNCTGLLRHVLIRKGFSTGELMVCLILNKKLSGKDRVRIKEDPKTCIFIPGQNVLMKRLAAIPGMTSISVNINTENTNVIMGNETYLLWGVPYIRDSLGLLSPEEDFSPLGTEVNYRISPASFYQVNPGQTEKLYSLALSYAGLSGKETVWDLYCGIGTISLFLAGKAEKVYGVEILEQAIVDAKENARENGIENVEFFVGKAEEVLPEKYEKEGIHADIIVVDPPRKGCDELCLQTIQNMQPEKIVYVSCDPGTLARDLRILCDGGYELKKVRGVDQFGMSGHIECVVALHRVGM